MDDIRQQADDEINDLIDHLVFREGSGPNGSGGAVEYWKDGERITGLEAIRRLVEAHTRQALENFGEFCHEQYTGCQKDDNGQDEYCYRGEVVTMVEQYKALQHPASPSEAEK